jgi:hypothetical protein
MAEAAVSDVIDLPDVSAERFAGKAWMIGDLDTQSFTEAIVAIERLCEVLLTKLQKVESTCAAMRDATGTTAPCGRACRLSGPAHVIDPAAFDW